MSKTVFVIRSAGWVGLAVLATATAYMFGWKLPSTDTPFALSPALVPNVSSTRVLLGIRTLQPSDRLFLLKLPEKTLEEQTVPKEWRATELSGPPTSTHLDVVSGGVATLVFADGSKVPLRTRPREPYQDVVFLGFFDDTHAALYGRRDERFILSVSRAGEVRELYEVPENAEVIGFDTSPPYQGGVAGGQRGSVVWIVSSQPGPGIESPPQGPSALIRVAGDGVIATVATDTHVIITARETGDGLAYGTDAGGFIVMRGSARVAGSGFPLAWIDGQHLLFAQGTSVYLFDLAKSERVPAAILPGTPSVAKVE